MMRYYFDLRDGNELAPDEEGIELWSRERVEEEATKSLAEFARDAFREHLSGGGSARRFAIEVWTDYGPVLQARFTFEIAKQGSTPSAAIYK
jgi:hypothetical protein